MCSKHPDVHALEGLVELLHLVVELFINQAMEVLQVRKNLCKVARILFQSLVECFSDDPESVCVCEKVDGATRIQRLNKKRLSSWLEDYTLGQLWAKSEIGGNRW